MARRVLAEGKALLVFPEGTRGEEGFLREAKPGAALLAVQSGAAVVPAYVHGAGRAWPRGRRLPRPVKVRVTFGAPLRFQRAAGAERKAQYEAASRQMMTAIAELRDRAVGGVGVARARRPLQIH
jgi:1-acyl-sn-glycerol-3-phosphate acyltransferase